MSISTVTGSGGNTTFQLPNQQVTDYLVDSQRRLFVASVVNALAYGLIVAFTSVSARFILSSAANFRTRALLFGHSMLVLALATAYATLNLLSQGIYATAEVEAAAGGAFLFLWEQTNATIIVWAMNMWVADGFMLYMEVLAWRTKQRFTWTTILLYIGYLVSSMFGIFADLGKANLAGFIVSLIIHLASAALLIYRIVHLIRRKKQQRTEKEDGDIQTLNDDMRIQQQAPIPAFIMNGGVYTLTRVAWIPSVWVGGTQYWANYIVVIGAVIAPHLVVMHVLLAHQTNEDGAKDVVSPVESLNTVSPSMSQTDVRTSAHMHMPNSLVMDHNHNPFKFWSRSRSRVTS